MLGNNRDLLSYRSFQNDDRGFKILIHTVLFLYLKILVECGKVSSPGKDTFCVCFKQYRIVLLLLFTLLLAMITTFC